MDKFGNEYLFNANILDKKAHTKLNKIFAKEVDLVFNKLAVYIGPNAKYNVKPYRMLDKNVINLYLQGAKKKLLISFEITQKTFIPCIQNDLSKLLRINFQVQDISDAYYLINYFLTFLIGAQNDEF